jgi:hypothetical protein
MAFIYALTFPNGKKYVGFTVNSVNKRWHDHHYSALNGGKTKLHCAIRKYGFENIEKEILYENDDSEYTLKVMENHFIKLFNTIEDGYNICEGGGKFPVYHGEDNPGYHRKNKKMEEWFNPLQVENHKLAMKKRHSGAGNVHARKVKLIDPNGKEYFIHGTLVSFCEEKNISFKTLYRCLNENNGGTIGSISIKATKLVHKERRENTTGWSIFPLD